MNLKDQINFIALQEQVITLLLKIKVIEGFLVEKNLFTIEEYNTKLTEASASIEKDLQPVKEQLDKLVEAIKQQSEKQDTAATPAIKEGA